VLGSGAVPLSVLEDLVRVWVSASLTHAAPLGRPTV
jgi:hypothetical protein